MAFGCRYRQVSPEGHAGQVSLGVAPHKRLTNEE